MFFNYLPFLFPMGMAIITKTSTTFSKSGWPFPYHQANALPHGMVRYRSQNQVTPPEPLISVIEGLFKPENRGIGIYELLYFRT